MLHVLKLHSPSWPAGGDSSGCIEVYASCVEAVFPLQTTRGLLLWLYRSLLPLGRIHFHPAAWWKASSGQRPVRTDPRPALPDTLPRRRSAMSGAVWASCRTETPPHPRGNEKNDEDEHAAGYKGHRAENSGPLLKLWRQHYPLTPTTSSGLLPVHWAGSERVTMIYCVDILWKQNVLYAVKSTSGFVPSWKTWKSPGILKWSFPGLESHGKILNHKSFGKVVEMCYHTFISADSEIIYLFFKERRSKYNPAYALLLAAQLLFFRVASERTLTVKLAGHLFNLMFTVCFGIHSLNTKCSHCFMDKSRCQFGHGHLV